jgi:hypothetical protein
VPGGGAASQFAGLIGASGFDNRTIDGCTTVGVLAELDRPFDPPDIVTCTVCGNDLLMGLALQAERGAFDWRTTSKEITERFDEISRRLRTLRCLVIVNTVYDPTDGKDDLAKQMGLPAEVRPSFDFINNHIRKAGGNDVMVSDLELLFRGHGYWSTDPWITGYIEPNHAGATAIARHWLQLAKTCWEKG